MKTKIKSHGNGVTDFYDKEIPKVDSNHTCLAVISLNSALKKRKTIIGKCFYKCKYIEEKVIRHINGNSSDFSSDDDSDEE